MKKLIELDQEKLDKVKKSFNSLRDPETDWQSLMKALIQQVMDDYIRLQHPSRRDFLYLKEAFCSAIGCLYDADYQIAWPSEVEGELIYLSFKEVLTQRFGLENVSEEELSKINMGIIQEECIQDAKAYWLDKQLQIVRIPDFLIFDGRAFSIWRTNDESSIDYDNMIINLESITDERELAEQFLKLSLEIAAYYRDMKIKSEQIEQMASIVYELLRMNSCFRN